MTLHKAIEQLLENGNQILTAREIADSLNQLKLYSKANNSEIKSSQISARINKYQDMFEVLKSYVPYKIRLKRNEDFNKIVTDFKKRKSIENIPKNVLHDSIINYSYLFDDRNFMSVSIIDDIVPKGISGIYCVRVSDIDKLPKEYRNYLKQMNHNILYIGIAKTCLNKRFLKQELRGKGHGTFFRSIGALLGFLPDKGSLSLNSVNYKFNNHDKNEIIAWINQNLIVNWLNINADFESLETEFILEHKPLLNISKNPYSLKTLSELRAFCVNIARS